MVYRPIYHRAPNVFVSYHEEDRGLYVERIATYIDQNKKTKTMTAQILWKVEPFLNVGCLNSINKSRNL